MIQIENNSHLNLTPLYALHQKYNAKLVDFANYSMPIYYPNGIIKEHLHCRQACGLFDVSHMGQIMLSGSIHIAALLETLVPSNIQTLPLNAIRYSVLLNEAGGVIDDLMITKQAEDAYFLVVNASRKHIDFNIIQELCKTVPDIQCDLLSDTALIALQGPQSSTVLEPLLSGCSKLKFMHSHIFSYDGHKLHVSRSGYSGQDGFEISLPSHLAVPFVTELLKNPLCLPIGLGARDSLRLEAGLCLYGHELTEDISPIEARLQWIIPKRRRQEANFPGSQRILNEISKEPSKKRVGILPEGRSPIRDGATILNQEGKECGYITSGGFSPSLKMPICMGYVNSDIKKSHSIFLEQRQKKIPAQIVNLPFIRHSYTKN